MKRTNIARLLGGMMIVAMASALSAQVSSDNAERYPKRDDSRAGLNSKSIRATFTVEPGQSIQAAVDRARPGDRVEIKPGIYYESVTVDFDDIQLVGIIENGERPVLDGKGTMNDAVLASGNDFYIANLELRNYVGNGVVVNQAKNCTFENIVANATGKYGVYPVLSDGVFITDCVVSNVWDAGIYAGQCKNVVIQNSETYHNTIGIETENCVGVLVNNNTAHDNALGFLIVLLPDLPTKVASDARVINNRAYNNNFPNLSPPGNLVNGVDPGVGIVVLATDNTEVTLNEVEGNNSFGIVLSALTDTMPDRELDVEPNPDRNYIHHNRFANNGAKLSERYIKLGLTEGGDLFWSGTGTGNGWDEASTKTHPAELPKWSGGEIPSGGAGR